MPLVLNHGEAVFLHCYKTGGTWVREALQNSGVQVQNCGYQHADFLATVDLYPRSERFTIVRNPLDWYASFWCWATSVGWNRGDLSIGFISKKPVLRPPTFAEFIYDVTFQRRGFLTQLYARFGAGQVTTTTLKTENLVNDLVHFLVKTGINFDEGKLKSTERTNVIGQLPENVTLTQYDDTMKQAVCLSEQPTFANFYSLGE